MSDGERPSLPRAILGTKVEAWPRQRSPALWASGLLILALWLALRPYAGIVHDARFYALQALHLLDAEAFRGDLYFSGGTPDAFPPISGLYAWAIARLGLGPANLTLTVLCQALWLAGLAWLARALIVPGRLALLGIVLAIALPGGYGGLQLFRYGEPFLTPRLLAEALSMIGLALMLSGRPLLCWPVLAAATVAHPLMGWPALAVAFVWAAAMDRRWLIAPAAAAGLCAALAALGVQPLPRLLQAFDAQWLRLIEARSPYALIGQWTILDFARLLSEAGLALAALSVAHGRLRRFLLACLAVGLGGLLLSVLAGDLARDVLVVQLQPWRSLWLLTLAASLAAGPLYARALDEDAAGGYRLIVIGGLAAMVAARISQGFLVVPPFLFLLGLPLLRREARPGSRRAEMLRLALAVALSLLSLGLAGKVVSLMQPSSELAPGLVEAVIAAAVLGSAAALLRSAPGAPANRPLSLLAVALLLLAAGAWDRRSELERFVASGTADAELARLLPQGAGVYWDGAPELLWFKLRRPSYFSCSQGTGGLFSRETAVEYDRRMQSFRLLHTADFEYLPGGACPSSPASAAAAPTSRSLTDLCDREPGLDYLVLARPIEQAYFARWRSPAVLQMDRVGEDGRPPLRPRPVEDFYLYRCRDLRSRAAGRRHRRSGLRRRAGCPLAGPTGPARTFGAAAP